MPKHCPICGASSDNTKFYGQFCESCTIERIKKDMPKSVEISICKRCGRIKSEGHYVEPSLEAIAKNIEKQFSSRGYIVEIEGGGDVYADVRLVSKSPEQPDMALRVSIEYSKTLCPVCQRRAAGYYEAIYQLRGSEEKMQRFIKRLDRVFSGDEFISRIEKVDNGYDVYLSSKSLASAFLAENRIKAVASYSLHGMRNGKRVYRNTYSISFA